MVFYSHAFGLAFQSEPLIYNSPESPIPLGRLGVCIFFVTSGFLVTGSFYGSEGNLKRFFASRCLRIYPAYIVQWIVVILIVGTCATTLPLQEYFAGVLHNAPAYLKAMVFFTTQPPTLPGVFQSHPSNVPNGPIWTLKIEAGCYIFLALALACQVYLRCRHLLAFFALVAMEFIIWMKIYLSSPLLLPFSIMLCIAFVMGSLLYLYKEHIVFSLPVTLGGIALICLLHDHPSLAMLLYWPLVAYGVIAVAFYPPFARMCRLRQKKRGGDYSYGIYIYAWPMQQLCLDLFPGNFPAFFGVSLALTLGCAVASWHGVEKYALALKPRRPRSL